MVRKTILISISTFCVLLIVSIFIQSCKPCKQKICDFTFNVLFENEADSLNINLEDGIDTSITGLHFSFEAFNDPDNPACAWKYIGLNTAYAYTPHCTVTNPIVDDSYWCSFDREIILMSDTIKSGVNLVQHLNLKEHWTLNNIFAGNGSPPRVRVEGSAHLDSMIFNQLQFETGLYNVTFGFSTEDGQELRKDLKVIYKL